MADNPTTEESENDTPIEVKHLNVKAGAATTGFQKKDIKTSIQIKQGNNF